MKQICIFLLNRHIWINPISLTKAFLRRPLKTIESRSILFLDVDGTVWEDRGPGSIFMKPAINPAIRSTIKKARKLGLKVVLVTNQTFFCYQEVLAYRTFFKYLLLATKITFNLRVMAILVCHHHPQANFLPLKQECIFRKPSPNMLNAFKRIYSFVPDNSIFIGDRITDMACATLGGIKNTFLVQNPRMMNRNIQSSNEMPEYLIFSLIPMNRTSWKIFE